MSIIALVSCENAEILKSTEQVADNKPILSRGNCQDCQPDDECCCRVALDGSSSGTLYICGIIGGTDMCQAFSADCFSSSFTNGAEDFSLSTSSSLFDFCMFEGGIFYIWNKGSSSVNLIITCQRGETTPQQIQIQIPANGRVYFETDSNCDLTECNT